MIAGRSALSIVGNGEFISSTDSVLMSHQLFGYHIVTTYL